MCHQPWQCFYLLRRKDEMKEKQTIDTDNMKPKPGEDEAGKESKERTEPNEFGDNQFFGPWFSYKTTHSIMINGTTKDSVP